MSMSAQIRPSFRSYNSWDSMRQSERNVPTIDTFTMAPILEAGTRRPSVVPSVHVDEAAPLSIYRLGWRSYVQIWAALATTTTLTIASFNLYDRLHGKS